MHKNKRILVSTNYHGAYTGFGKNCKNILSHLYSTGKYEIIEFANGVAFGSPDLELSPWETIGAVPNNPELVAQFEKDNSAARMANYGFFSIDQTIKEKKPDVFIGIEDIWAFNGYWDKPWWNKVNCMVWTTLDSLPILPEALKMADNVKDFYVWASFAEEAMKKAGKQNVKTLHGSIDTKNFTKLTDQNRADLKKTFNLHNSFVIGFVFRNQLRKSVPNLLDGFKMFISKNPEANAKLLLHTNWAEGWDIVRLCADRGISLESVVTTYTCAKCKNYAVSNFLGHGRDCPYCGSKGTFSTTNINQGINEKQLNEVYNMMDVYCHPFTSGGQEIPIQEAKLCELITLVTDYSCGTDMCSAESGGFPLDWEAYSEPGTLFIKATTNPKGISKKLEKVYKMKPEKRASLGKKARDYIVKNYSSEVVGKKIEAIIDNMPDVDFDFESIGKSHNKDFEPDFSLEDSEFIKSMYEKMLNIPFKKEDIEIWTQKIKNGSSKEQVFDHFKSILSKQKISLEDALDKNDKGRVGLAIEGDSFMGLAHTYFIKSLKEMYPEWSLYCFASPSAIRLFDGMPEIKKTMPYIDGIKHAITVEGSWDNKGLFDVFYHIPQSMLAAVEYSHNCKDKNAYS